jgi:hypothetical protein
MCRALGVGEQVVRAALASAVRPGSERLLRFSISTALFTHSRQTCGAPRIHPEFIEEQRHMSRKPPAHFAPAAVRHRDPETSGRLVDWAMEAHRTPESS